MDNVKMFFISIHNSARSLGFALISGHIKYLWIYMTALLTGFLLAVFIYRFIKSKEWYNIDKSINS